MAVSFILSPVPTNALRSINTSYRPTSRTTLTVTYASSTAYVPSESQKEDEEKATGKRNLFRWGKDKIPILTSKKKKQGKKNVKRVSTLEDYKKHVVDVTNKIVVVRFYASWCRSCKAAAPSFYRMVGKHSPDDVTFVEVPLLRENAFLHEGLGVPSVPFGHIYHPEAGLVEEMKVSKKNFRPFEEALNSYVRGSCNLDGDEDISFENDVVYVDTEMNDTDTPIRSAFYP